MLKKYYKRHKLSNSSKSQAALEFLATYAWAFVIILITIGALYYFGIFDFSKFLPQECIFPSQFKCLDFNFATGVIKFKLINNIGEKITITEWTITNDANPPLSCTTTPPISPPDWNSSGEKDFTFTGCSGGAFISGERTEARITMKYYAVDTPSKPIHTLNGKIMAAVD